MCGDELFSLSAQGLRQLLECRTAQGILEKVISHLELVNVIIPHVKILDSDWSRAMD